MKRKLPKQSTKKKFFYKQYITKKFQIFFSKTLKKKILEIFIFIFFRLRKKNPTKKSVKSRLNVG